MSKFLKIFAPALGGTASMLAMAYVLADQFVVDFPAPMRGVTEANAQVAPVAPATPAAVAAVPEAPVVRVAAHGAGGFGLGREALPEEIAAWDLDVSPDGTGLPVGSGDVMTGETVFEENCAVCHGSFAEGVDNWPKLAGGQGTLADKDPLKTVGSYWPYLSTVYDYVHRSMPFGNAQSLSDDDVYAIVAYILYSNDLVGDDFTLSNENFLEVELPNAGGFIVDDRAEAEYAIWRAEPCMENCKDEVKITMRATVLDVTPEQTAARAAEEAAAAASTTQVAAAASTEAAPVAAESEPASEGIAHGGIDLALASEGESAFRQCKSCHQVGEGAVNRSGPQLNELIGRAAGTAEGFRYSNQMVSAGDGGLVWTAETLADFLMDPKGYVNGTKMSFRGFKEREDALAVVEYLKTFSQ